MASIQKTSDFTGNKFVVLTLPSQHKLWLLRFTDDIGEPLSFGAVTTLVATQVVPIEAHPMMVVLEPSTGLSLYSGYYKVNKSTESIVHFTNQDSWSCHIVTGLD